MKSSFVWLAFAACSLLLVSCGKDEPAADSSKQDQNLTQNDQPAANDSLDTTRDRGAPLTLPRNEFDGGEVYDDEPPAVPPIPKSKLLDSIGRALMKGAKDIGNE